MDHQLSLMRVIAIRLTVGVALGCSLYACKEDAGAQPQTSVVDGNASVPAFDRPPSDPGAAKAKPAADMAKPQAATEDG